MGPSGHGIPDPEVLVTGGWESVRTVVDVGGGTGSLLAEILRARPTVRGTLVDLPPKVARSLEIFQIAGVAERVTAVGQSFFDPLPAGADLYLLKNVLGDWLDREAMAILRRCARRRARRSHRRPRRGIARRGLRSVAVLADDGLGGREGPEPGGVPRAGSRRRVGRTGRRAATVGPLGH